MVNSIINQYTPFVEEFYNVELGARAGSYLTSPPGDKLSINEIARSSLDCAEALLRDNTEPLPGRINLLRKLSSSLLKLSSNITSSIEKRWWYKILHFFGYQARPPEIVRLAYIEVSRDLQSLENENMLGAPHPARELVAAPPTAIARQPQEIIHPIVQRVMTTTTNVVQTRPEYGLETVPSINSTRNVRLNGTVVTGEVTAASSVTATDANVAGRIMAGGSVTLTSTTTRDLVQAGGSITSDSSTGNSLMAGGSITANNSNINSLSSGGSATLNQCRQLGTVQAGGSANVRDCANIRSLSAGGSVTLHHSQVTGDVSAGGRANIENSTIGGRLTCSPNDLVIRDSHIDTLYLRASSSGIQISNGGTNINIGGVHVGQVTGQVVRITGHVGNLEMRDDDIFIDGVSINQLQANPPPQGPPQLQTIRLINSTVKDIIFEGRNGEIDLSGGSQVTGTITGGRIRV